MERKGAVTVPSLFNALRQNEALNYRFRNLTTEDYPGFYHYHRGIEILIVHRGTGHLVLNRRMHSIASGSILFFQPYQLHRLHFDVNEQSPYERTIITFEPSSFEPFFRMFPTVHRFFEHMWKEDLASQMFQMGTQTVFIDAVLERFHDYLTERDEEEQLESAALMIIQIVDYIQSLNVAGLPQGSPRTERHAEKIMQWIEKHYTEPFDLDELAKELHLSRHHVSHLFRRETGGTITDYLIARRIRQACWLLRVEPLSIEQIGAKVGIPHFAYFCRLFKKITGVTPKQYRSSSR
ncbi:AraC family transcriptional regulator [Paenibacillus rigui]|uniref:AraC family transcriptional regulator n=1 Tax=Paenibacillus rigui TaxID=554312 RepID=A0A229UV78_9BACL|nr:helix-turn-helix domain-containing protein [Paenibacillus rigui]OXM87507.1 AraC family transcriptional regulator [Paenibacillus rigui]